MTVEEEMDRDLQLTGARLTGHFRLRSGRCSDAFFQFARLGALAPLRLRHYDGLLGELLRPHRPEVVVGIAKGGMVPGHEAACRLSEPSVGGAPLTDVVSVYAEKARFDQEKGMWVADESSETLRLLRGFDALVPGKRVAIVEDAVTTGGSAGRLARHVRELGGAVVAMGMLLQRGEVRDGALADVPTVAVVRKTVADHDPDSCPQRDADGTHLPFTPIPGKR